MRPFLNHSLSKNMRFQCLPPAFPSSPPWALLAPKVILNLLKFPKKSTDSSVYRTHFLDILNSLPNAVPCFTDGSVGFSYSINDKIIRLRHHNSASILNAELQAIFQCLEDILFLSHSHSHSFLICSDSLPPCQPSPIHRQPTHSSVVSIHALLSTLDSISITITLIQKIDAVAKSAVQLPRIHAHILPRKSDLTLFIRHRITDLWTSHWQNQKTINKLAMLKPLLWPWDSSHQPHRRHEIYSTHLRIGQTRLNHSHLLSNLHPLSCDLTAIPTMENCYHIRKKCRRNIARSIQN